MHGVTTFWTEHSGGIAGATLRHILIYLTYWHSFAFRDCAARFAVQARGSDICSKLDVGSTLEMGITLKIRRFQVKVKNSLVDGRTSFLRLSEFRFLLWEKYINIPSEKYVYIYMYIYIYMCVYICVFTYPCKMHEYRYDAVLS